MKPWVANLVNAIVLISMGLWSYLTSETPSPTALIPVAFGVLFAASTPLFQKDNRVVAHIVVVLTLLLLIALVRPLTSAIGKGELLPIIRTSIMLGMCLIAMVIYVKSFIDARKARQNA